MHHEVFEILTEAMSPEDMQKLQPKARKICLKYLEELDGDEIRELAIRRRVSRLSYSHRCAEASAA